MSAKISVSCDRCGVEVISTPTSLLELRHGQHRLRRSVDLCTRCYEDFLGWQGAGAEPEGIATVHDDAIMRQ